MTSYQIAFLLVAFIGIFVANVFVAVFSRMVNNAIQATVKERIASSLADDSEIPAKYAFSRPILSNTEIVEC